MDLKCHPLLNIGLDFLCVVLCTKKLKWSALCLSFFFNSAHISHLLPKFPIAFQNNILKKGLKRNNHKLYDVIIYGILYLSFQKKSEK